ncbi:MAG: hypothetical protein WCW16_05205 [Candidatus Magasanikbacteria bacterium]
MPNHVHGILEICDDTVVNGNNITMDLNNDIDMDCADGVGVGHAGGIAMDLDNAGSVGAGRGNDLNMMIDMERGVGTGLDLSLHAPGSYNILSLSNIIGALKTTTSKRIHEIGFPQFKWQRSFYDNIIRNETAFHNIQRYIIYNPPMWNRDRNNRPRL